MRERTYIGSNRHLVVIEDDQERQLECAGVVQRLERHPSGQGPVANDGNNAAFRIGPLRERDRHAQSRRNRGRGVPRAKRIVLTLVS